MKKLLPLIAMILMIATPSFAEEAVNYLCFTAQEDNSSIRFDAWYNGIKPCNIQTSTDTKTWKAYEIGTTIPLSKNEKVYFKGDYSGLSYYFNLFYMEGKIAASGNIMTLTDGDHPTKSLEGKEGAFTSLFENCTALTSAPELPATTLSNHCYTSMFAGCTSLVSAPELPATTVTDDCYNSMFARCASLTSAPVLPATTMANACYAGMFSGCSSLTSAPELPSTNLAQGCYTSMFMDCSSLKAAPTLPATTLADFCYNTMFAGCKSLTTAPELPATKLVTSCYADMFTGCTNLNYIKVAFTDWNLEQNATQAWMKYVGEKGTFICPENLETYKSINGMPYGWTIQTYEPTTGISAANQNTSDTLSPIFDLNGKKVSKDYKGIVISNNKKIIQK